jgi:hypothetical protein
VWKLQRALTPEEVKQALAAGCGGPGHAASNGGPSAPAGNPDPNGFDLGSGGGTVLRHQVAAGQPITFTFTSSPGRVPSSSSSGSRGTRFEPLHRLGPGLRRARDGAERRPALPAGGPELAPGRYSYTVAAEPGGALGITLP